MARASKKSAQNVNLGSWAFLIGVAAAIILGFISGSNRGVEFQAILTLLLVILGIIVGVLNVTVRETTPFLLAAVSLVIITSFGGAVLGSVDTIGPYIEGILAAILTLVLPAAIIVAFKMIYGLAADV